MALQSEQASDKSSSRAVVVRVSGIKQLKSGHDVVEHGPVLSNTEGRGSLRGRSQVEELGDIIVLVVNCLYSSGFGSSCFYLSSSFCCLSSGSGRGFFCRKSNSCSLSLLCCELLFGSYLCEPLLLSSCLSELVKAEGASGLFSDLDSLGLGG